MNESYCADLMSDVVRLTQRTTNRPTELSEDYVMQLIGGSLKDYPVAASAIRKIATLLDNVEPLPDKMNTTSKSEAQTEALKPRLDFETIKVKYCSNMYSFGAEIEQVLKRRKSLVGDLRVVEPFKMQQKMEALNLDYESVAEKLTQIGPRKVVPSQVK